MKLSVVIPVYHEEKNIQTVLNKISEKIKTEHEIIIVYDSPTDPTYKVIKKYLRAPKSALQLIKNNTGNGKGVMNAIKTGFSAAKGEAVVVVMADLSDDISQIDKMYKLIKKGNTVVCASRFMRGGKKIGGTFLKNFLSKFADLTLHFLVGLPTHDATNAYKMYRKEFLDSISVQSTGGFEYSLEITLKAFFKGGKIAEIPTTWKDREAGKSNFKLIEWLPQYIKWYLWALKEKFSLFGAYIFWVITAFVLTSFYIGSQIKDKIPVTSTLDLSWQSDAVERFLHGFLAGRDYIFTYGPLFQWIYSIPSIVFHIPSYVSVPLATILLSVFVGGSILYITHLVGQSRTDKIFLPALLLFIVGITPQLSGNPGIRFILPLVYGVAWFPLISAKRFSLIRLILLSLLPSFLGLYVYDLFPQTILIGLVAVSYVLLKGQQTISKKIIYGVSFMFGIIGFQIVTSLFISGNLSYTQNSLATLSDYFYLMNTPWEAGKSNLLFVFPLIMVILSVYLFRMRSISGRLKSILFWLTIIALTQLRTALIRSDTGHIMSALYPSIIVCFILVYHLFKERKTVGFLLFVLFFILVPFRDNYYGYLSAKNLSALVHVVKNGQQTNFQDVYSFPKEYKINPGLFTFIAQHNGQVMIFPYDSMLLNMQKTTFNTYALQFYDYSQSPVEKQTVTELSKNPPQYIVLQVDKYSTSPLDGIPNFTRNPLISEWMLQNYSVLKKYDSILLLKYTHKKVEMASAPSCSIWSIYGNFQFNSILDLIKPRLFYAVFNGGALRLPVKPNVHSYMVVPSSDNVNALVQLFNSSINFSIETENQTLESKAKIVSVNFLNQVTFYPDVKMFCVQ